MDKQDLTHEMEALLDADERILAGFLLGSACRGELRHDSDVDIAILPVGGKELSPVELLELAAALTMETGYLIDLGILSSANLVYARQAILTGERFMCRNESQVDYRVASLLGLAMQFCHERQEILDAYRA